MFKAILCVRLTLITKSKVIKMMNWLRNFMRGRAGIDALSMTLIVLALILSLFAPRFGIPPIIFLILIVIAYYRALSKKIYKRSDENVKFLKAVSPITNMFKKIKRKIVGRKHYKYFKCDNCRQKIRVPRGKGKIKVKCPNCGEVMIKKT